MIIDDLMTSKITLHGLGFVQIQLEGAQRLHVWHPELPRRTCFEHSSIHDHRFTFKSQVLVGVQLNYQYEHEPFIPGAVKQLGKQVYTTYLHEGARTACGGRPWASDGHIVLMRENVEAVHAGNNYIQQAYVYHRTQPGGNGKVATVMLKLSEGLRGAHSTCLSGIKPDTEFDRFQWTPTQLWEIVADVLWLSPKCRYS